MEDCLFCKIVAGEIEASKIYEDDDALAFLDINPAAPGHTLLIPKKHSADIFDIDEISLRRLSSALKYVATKIKNAIGSDVMILQNNGRTAGQIVAHLHFHIIPRTEGDGIGIARGKVSLSKDDMESVANKIKEASGS